MQKINKIIIKGKAKIYESENERSVVKPKKKDLASLFEYLSLRGLNNYPKVLEENKDEIRYEYIDSVNPFFEDRSVDEELIKSVAEMHYKTSYFKNVSRKKYKDIYNTLIDNIDYLKDFYSTLIKKCDTEVYMSPSSYLFARNYSIINSNLMYIERELNAWYNLVKDKTKERVSIVHNNLKKENFIRGKDNVFISWDNYLVDTPVLDIYKLYKSEYKEMDFVSLFKIYNDTFPFTKEEAKLLFVMISMPSKLELNSTEYEKVLEVKSLLDYTYRTNEIIKSGIFD